MNILVGKMAAEAVAMERARAKRNKCRAALRKAANCEDIDAAGLSEALAAAKRAQASYRAATAKFRRAVRKFEDQSGRALKLREDRLSAAYERVQRANDFIAVVAGCGRRFFGHGPVAFFELDDKGRVWFTDDYSGRKIFTHNPRKWRWFSHGGTLRRVVESIRDYIRTGAPQNVDLGPWPSWISGGDLWGYGEDMQKVRDEAHRLGIKETGNG